MLHEEAKLYSRLTGKDGYKTSISIIGAYLDGYEKGKADAQPEIIRCKDCKYAHITYEGEVKYCDIWFPNESHYIDTDNYCSFAERRTDERSD